MKKVGNLRKSLAKSLCIFVSVALLASLSCLGFSTKKAEAAYDTTAPVITNITFNQSVKKPGIITVTMNIKEDDTGANYIYIGFSEIEDGSINGTGATSYFGNNFWNNNGAHFSGNYTFSIPVSSKVKATNYWLNQIQIKDNAGNERYYSYGQVYDNGSDKPRYGWQNGVNIPVNGGNNNKVTVMEEFDVEFQSHIANAGITSKLNTMPEGKTAMILFDRKNHIVKAEWFKAIKGKNKNLVLSNDNIQWHFNGKDITDAKDIDCFIEITNSSALVSAGSEKSIQLQFAPNGQLPGKALVKVKSDYTYTLMRLTNKLYLYYLKDNKSLKLEDNPNYVLDGTDHWCQFEVTHNSTFYVSGNKISSTSPFSLIKKIESTSKGMKITWNKLKNAAGYRIYRATVDKDNKFGQIKLIVASSTTSYVDKKANVNGQKYYYRVVPRTTYITSSGKTAYRSGSFRDVVSKASYFLSKPTGVKASNVNSKKLQVTWNKNSKASGYQIKYTLGKKSVTKTISKKSTLKKVLSNLTKGKTYKIQVRSYKKVGKTKYYSAWSSAKSVRIKK